MDTMEEMANDPSCACGGLFLPLRRGRQELMDLNEGTMPSICCIGWQNAAHGHYIAVVRRTFDLETILKLDLDHTTRSYWQTLQDAADNLIDLSGFLLPAFTLNPQTQRPLKAGDRVAMKPRNQASAAILEAALRLGTFQFEYELPEDYDNSQDYPTSEPALKKVIAAICRLAQNPLERLASIRKFVEDAKKRVDAGLAPRSVRLENKAFKANIAAVGGARDILIALGYREEDDFVPNREDPTPCMVFKSCGRAGAQTGGAASIQVPLYSSQEAKGAGEDPKIYTPQDQIELMARTHDWLQKLPGYDPHLSRRNVLLCPALPTVHRTPTIVIVRK